MIGRVVPDVSVLIHTRDSAATLARALDSVAWSDDVVVLDMASTDGTVDIARARGARVVALPAEPWSDAIRNRHLGEARHAWTLVLDADERLPDDAAVLVGDLLSQHGARTDCFAIPRINTVAGQVLQGGDWGPDHQWRLFRSGCLTYAAAHHQLPMFCDGASRLHVVAEAHGLHIHHENYASLAELIDRQVRYALTDDYDPSAYDALAYEQRVHTELARRHAPEVDGDLSRAAALVLAWDGVLRRVLHWERSEPRPGFGESLPVPVLLAAPVEETAGLPAPVPGVSMSPPAVLEPPVPGTQAIARPRSSRGTTSLNAERELRRAWALHRTRRYQQTLRVRDALRLPLGIDPTLQGPDRVLVAADGIATTRRSLVAGALRRSARRRRLRLAEYPLPSLQDAAGAREEDVRASIIIPFHEQFELTLQCLEAATTTAVDVALEVILVDDGSALDRSAVLAEMPGIECVRLGTPQGFLAAANAGAARARGDVIVLLNNDTIALDGWLEALLEQLDDDAGVGIVGPMLLRPDGCIAEAGGTISATGEPSILGAGLPEDDARFAVPADVDYVSGACLAVSRTLWWELGGFDIRYAPAYFEDADLCLEARRRGYRVQHVPQARVVHLAGQSYGTDGAAAKDVAFAISQRTFRRKWGRELEQAGAAVVFSGSALGAHGSLLIVDVQLPRPDTDGGSARMHDIVLALLADDWDVTLLPADRITESPAAVELRARGVRVVDGIAGAQAALTRAPAAIMLCRPDPFTGYAMTLKAIWPEAALIYDTVDLHAHRLASQNALRGIADTGLVALVGAVEQAAFTACDLTLAVTPEEAETVRALAPGADVAIVPFMHRTVGGGAAREGREGMLFLGGYRHTPNVDAALRLADGVLPRVREHDPGATLTIAGTFPPPQIVTLAERPGIAVTGYVADLALLHSRALACVAPLDWGAGISTKLITAMAHGLPVITSTIGATGLGGRDGEHYLAAVTDEEFAACYQRLRDDADLWQRLSDNGRALVRERFDPAVATRPLLEWLDVRTGPTAAIRPTDATHAKMST
jgi:GT2 family glycosyltransferase